MSTREKKDFLFLLGALVGMAFFEMAGIASVMPFMAVVSKPEMVQTNKWLNWGYEKFAFSNTLDYLYFLGVLVLAFLVIGNLFKAYTAWLALRFDNQLYYALARRLLAQYLARPYSFFLNRNTADMGKNVLTEVRTVIGGVLSSGVQVLRNSLVSLSILALLVAVDPLVSMVVALMLGGAYAAIFLFARRKLSRISKEQVHANFMKFKTADEALSGIKDLKILRREWMFLEKFAVHARRHSLNNVTAGTISQIPRYALEILAFGGILMVILYFLGGDQDSGKMVPLLALYAFAGYRLLPAIQLIFSSFTSVQVNLAALDVLHRDLVSEWEGGDPETMLNGTRDLDPLPFSGSLEIKNVSFFYSGTQEAAVKGLNLTVPHNSTIGLVGSTGSGKTTTVDLILGLLEPTSGSLVVDRVEITPENLPCWQCNLGYVPQQIYLCDDTIARNIAFGIPDEEIELAAVVRAAKIANIHDFISSKLPEGYETVIGERGVRLSGGQRQRIGIARALYRDPKVLIMDEATSALDGITEEAVMEALKALSGKKTIIMIAHRLTTVKDCETIYLMEHGGLAYQGTYQNLMESSSWFREATRFGD